MTARIQLILLSIATALAILDIVWIRLGHFHVDGPAYAAMALLATLMAAGGIYYQRIRNHAALAAMLVGTAFLLIFSVTFSVLNTLLITVPGVRIDEMLAAIDRAMGFYWPSMVAWAAAHPLINAGMQLAYMSVLPQMAITMVCLGWRGQSEQIYEFCFAVAIGAVITVCIWTFARSLGTLTVYHLPAEIARRVALACDPAYGERLLWMAQHGPGYITPRDTKGLIAFPSFHAVLAILLAWCARKVPVLRWTALVLNALVLISTPIQGGHHVVDVMAGFAVATVAVLFTNGLLASARRAEHQPAVQVRPATA